MRSLHFAQLTGLTLFRVGATSDAAGDLLAAGLARAENLSELVLEDRWDVMLGPALQNLQRHVKLARLGSPQLASALEGMRGSAQTLWSLEVGLVVDEGAHAAAAAATVELATHAVADAVAPLTALERLCVFQMDLSESVFGLVRSLSRLALLRELSLQSCEIGDDGAQALLSVLPQLTRLRELWLADNAFGYPGMHGFEALTFEALTDTLMEAQNFLSAMRLSMSVHCH